MNQIPKNTRDARVTTERDANALDGSKTVDFDVLVIGAGPAGLMAAETARATGAKVAIFERMGSAARKFLIAGVGGLNLTHSEPQSQFVQRYRFDSTEEQSGSTTLARWLSEFPPQALRDFAADLGVSTVVGSSGRVFPSDFKAAPLVRGWLRRIKSAGVHLHYRSQCTSLTQHAGIWRAHFQLDDTELQVSCRSVILAMGGGSWAKLGSDGAWMRWLAPLNIPMLPLIASNCGFECSWSEHVQKHAGTPIKPVSISVCGSPSESWQRGELMLSEYGLEGGLLYAHSHAIRQRISELAHADTFSATIALDLLPDHSSAQLLQKLLQQNPKRSLSERLLRAWPLSAAKLALYLENLPAPQRNDADALVARIKALPIRFGSARAIDEAISTAGGIALSALDCNLMVLNQPGLYAAGEMLAWDAPTGGYLLTACFASGKIAGQAAARALTATSA